MASVRTSAGRGTLALPDAYAALADSVARTRNIVLVSLGSPYILQQSPSVASYLIGWTPNSVMEASVAKALAGVAAITGKLPISIPPLIPLGAGLELR